MENGITTPYKMRKRFVKIVDDLLSGLPDEAIGEFVDSDRYENYAAVAEHYQVT